MLRISFVTFLFAIFASTAQAGAEFDDMDLKAQGDSMYFVMGADGTSGVFGYGVDRKAKICWLGHNNSIAIVPCDTIAKAYPEIDKFLKTGKAK